MPLFIFLPLFLMLGSKANSQQKDTCFAMQKTVYIGSCRGPMITHPMKSSCTFTKFHYELYDRWGVLVQASDDPDIEIDPRRRMYSWPEEKESPRIVTGTYTYVIDYQIEGSDSNFVRTGVISVIY